MHDKTNYTIRGKAMTNKYTVGAINGFQIFVAYGHGETWEAAAAECEVSAREWMQKNPECYRLSLVKCLSNGWQSIRKIELNPNY